MPYRYFIHLAYDGTEFCGWQNQPNGKTVQSELEAALTTILRIPSEVTGCGRTDSGVHASDFIAHCDMEEPLKDPHKLVFKLNRFLPSSIVIYSIFPVRKGIHARFSAISREYVYRIALRKDPFSKMWTSSLPVMPDIELMNQGASLLMNHTDFECFSKVKTQVATFECRIYSAQWKQVGDKLEFRICADRFLRNMVRAIVGTLLDLGMKKISLSDLETILLSHDRRKAGQSVPAKGLTLVNVKYPDNYTAEQPEFFSYAELMETGNRNETD